MAAPRARIVDLMKVQCQVFSTTFNPKGIRTGNKILRQRLRGPSLAAYYPRRGPDLYTLYKEFKHLHLLGDNEKHEDWEEHIEELKERGKGAPKKKKVAAPDKGKK